MNDYLQIWASLDRIQAAAERIRDLQTPEFREETADDVLKRQQKITASAQKRLGDAVWICEAVSELPEETIRRIADMFLIGRAFREAEKEVDA